MSYRPDAMHDPIENAERSPSGTARGSRRNVPKRRRGRALVGLLKEAWVEFERDRAHYLAMAIIYYAGISIVPMLLLLLSTLGLLLRFSETAVEVERHALQSIEAQFGSQLATSVNRLLEALQRDSVTATVISVLGVLVSASLLFRQLRMTFRAVWNYEPPLVAGPIHVRLFTLVREWVIAFVITLGGGALLFVALVVISAFKWIDRLLDSVPFLPPSGGLSAAVSSFVLAAITFGALFKVLPPRRVRWRDIWLAVLLCAGVWVGATELLPLYHRLVGEQNAYNAVGALLPLLISANIASQMLFYGAELCKVVTRRATPLSMVGRSSRTIAGRHSHP